MTVTLDGKPLAITNHRLHGVPFVEDDHGGLMDPSLIICHFTVTGSGPSTVRSMADPSIRASVHIVLAKDGTLTQMVPFDRVAWHAGKSRWNGRDGCNDFSIGIEIVNYGPLFPDGRGGWENVYGQHVDMAEPPYHGEHQGPPGCNWEWWEPYTTEQMLTLADLCRLLCDFYKIREIVGHDDVSPGRKRDPGPAFDWHHLRKAVFGPPEENHERPR